MSGKGIVVGDLDRAPMCCIFCQQEKQFNRQGLRAHLMHCQAYRDFMNRGPSENHFLVDGHHCMRGETKETSDRVRQRAENLSKMFQEGTLTPWAKITGIPEKVRRKISDSMKLAHAERRAHNIGECRWKCEPSGAEKFFMQGMAWTFDDTDYDREVYLTLEQVNYSFDFVWFHKKRVIEVDGEQHEGEYQSRVDKEKDERAQRVMNWDVLRIPWKELLAMPTEWYEYANKWLHTKR